MVDVVDMYTDTVIRCILEPSFLWGGSMPKFVDRTNIRYGQLTAVSQAGRNKHGQILWLCKCDCGNEVNVLAGSLTTGNTKSCGCVVPNLKHGGWKKSSYNTWRAMMRRCTNPNDKDYPRYGAKGITVSPEWADYRCFVKDMGEPDGKQTLDRIDPYGNYCKENCRWADITTQNRNLRVRETSKSGYIGVRPRGKKWMAEITVNKRKFYAKIRDTVAEAAQDRKELERLHWRRA